MNQQLHKAELRARRGDDPDRADLVSPTVRREHKRRSVRARRRLDHLVARS